MGFIESSARILLRRARVPRPTGSWVILDKGLLCITPEMASLPGSNRAFGFTDSTSMLLDAQACMDNHLSQNLTNENATGARQPRILH